MLPNLPAVCKPPADHIKAVDCPFVESSLNTIISQQTSRRLGKNRASCGGIARVEDVQAFDFYPHTVPAAFEGGFANRASLGIRAFKSRPRPLSQKHANAVGRGSQIEHEIGQIGSNLCRPHSPRSGSILDDQSGVKSQVRSMGCVSVSILSVRGRLSSIRKRKAISRKCAAVRT